MDTHKIDKKMRAFVMAPIFGFLAFLVLFPVFVSIDAGSVSMDFGVLTIGVEEIKVAMDWILATCVGVAGAALVIHQIRQASLRDTERTKLVLDKNFRYLVIAAANNIRFSETSEGYLHFDGEVQKYIICWRHDEVNSRISQFNMMFLIMNGADTEISALENLRNTEDPNRWSFRILIPLFDQEYGTVSESSISGREFSEIDVYSHRCITHAVNYIQTLDDNEMKQCRIDFDENDLRIANDAYLGANIITQAPRVGEARDIS